MSSTHCGSSGDHSLSLTPSLVYQHQHSQASSSIGDSEEAPMTGSSIVSDNPFIFGTAQVQNGSTPQYQNRSPHVYQNGSNTLPSTSASYSNMMEQQGSSSTLGARTIGSYPLFPIPEHTVPVVGHFNTCTPSNIPNRAHPQSKDEPPTTVMTDNPAFHNVRLFFIILNFFFIL